LPPQYKPKAEANGSTGFLSLTLVGGKVACARAAALLKAVHAITNLRTRPDDKRAGLHKVPSRRLDDARILRK
jgi:hypothetical protein